ncbi:MAG: ABC transporter ATP-binding protein [Thermoprotei archaeon]|nr:MAG: ABC transporter ATP-binding protein [Thermoprotei archaeon]
MKIIEFKNVTFMYRGNSEPSLLNVNVEIERGEFILLTGPSGCGKSTFCRLLNGLIPHFYGGELKGEVTVLGMNVKNTPTYELARHVGMVFQDPENQLFLSSVEKEIAFGLENLGLPREEIKRRVNQVIKYLGLENIREKAPYELSGGQQQKVAIASVLAMQPEVLVLDEPTANLDPYSSLELLNIITRLNRELKITIILVEHRLEMLLDKVSRLMLMDKGKIVVDGPPQDVVLSPEMKIVGIPKVIEVYDRLKKAGYEFGHPPLSPEDLAKAVRRVIGFHD